MDGPHLIELFDKHMFALIKECRLNHKEAILMIDANKDIYKGKLAEAIDNWELSSIVPMIKSTRKRCRPPTSQDQRPS